MNEELYYIKLHPELMFKEIRDHSGHGLSQWEKVLHNNAFSHWLSPYPELSWKFIKIFDWWCQHYHSLVGDELTHWGRVRHLCVGNLIIGWDNGMSPGRHRAIFWSNTGILLFRPFETNFSEILIAIHTFSLKKCSWKYQNGGYFVSPSNELTLRSRELGFQGCIC